MGRKGVSKRKPAQAKFKPFTGSTVNGNGSSFANALAGAPVKPHAIGVVLPGGKNVSNAKKNALKG